MKDAYRSRVPFNLTSKTIRRAICGYNNHGCEKYEIECYCEDFPLDEWNEPEYQGALKTRHPKNIIIWLKRFGMARVLGKFKIMEATDFQSKIYPFQPLINSLNGHRIEKMPLDRKDTARLIELFDRLRMDVGPTNAGKILHILLPDLCIPWDGAIRDLMGVGDEGKDYLEFLTRNSTALRRLLNRDGLDVARLEGFFYTSPKPVTKLIDEVLWTITREPPPRPHRDWLTKKRDQPHLYAEN